MGWLYVCGSACGFVVNVLAVMFIFVGSWYPTGFPVLKVWNEWMLAFTAVSVISGIAIYLISAEHAPRGRPTWSSSARGAATQEIAEGHVHGVSRFPHEGSDGAPPGGAGPYRIRDQVLSLAQAVQGLGSCQPRMSSPRRWASSTAT